MGTRGDGPPGTGPGDLPPSGPGDDEVLEADAVALDGDVHTPGGVWRDGFVGSNRRPGTFRSTGDAGRAEPPSPTGAVWRDGMRIAERRAAVGDPPDVSEAPEPTAAAERPAPGSSWRDLRRGLDASPGGAGTGAGNRAGYWRSARPWGGRRAGDATGQGPARQGPPAGPAGDEPPDARTSGPYRAVDLWRDQPSASATIRPDEVTPPPARPAAGRSRPGTGPHDAVGRRPNGAGAGPPRPAAGRGALVPWQDIRTTGSHGAVAWSGDGGASGPHPAIGHGPEGPGDATRTPGRTGGHPVVGGPGVGGSEGRSGGSGSYPAVGGTGVGGSGGRSGGSGSYPAVGGADMGVPARPAAGTGGHPVVGGPGVGGSGRPAGGTGGHPVVGGPAAGGSGRPAGGGGPGGGANGSPRGGAGSYPAVTRDAAWRSGRSGKAGGPGSGSGAHPAIDAGADGRPGSRGGDRSGGAAGGPPPSIDPAWDGAAAGPRDLRRMVVSPLDPPLARVTGELPAVPALPRSGAGGREDGPGTAGWRARLTGETPAPPADRGRVTGDGPAVPGWHAGGADGVPGGARPAGAGAVARESGWLGRPTGDHPVPPVDRGPATGPGPSPGSGGTGWSGPVPGDSPAMPEQARATGRRAPGWDRGLRVPDGGGTQVPPAPRTAYPPPTGAPVDLPPPPAREPLQSPVGVEPATQPVARRRPAPGTRPPARRPAPPTRPATGRWLSRTGALTGLLVALGFAWLVLVTLRPPEPAGAPADHIGATLDDALADSLLADRAQSVLEWATNVTTTLALGGVIFRLFVVGRREDGDSPDGGDGPDGRPRPASTAVRIVRRAAFAGMAAELASVFVRAVAVSGMGLSAASDPRMLGHVVAGRFGSAALVRVAGLAILAGLAMPVETRPRSWPLRLARQGGPSGPSSRSDTSSPDATFWGPQPDRTAAPQDSLRLERLSCLVGGAVVLLSFALTGHPQATDAPALPAVQCVHVLVVSTWFGGVAFLAMELRQQRRDGTARVSAELVARFSSVATVTVVLALGTGLVLANSQLDSIDALLSTDYGHALIAKLSALSIPLAIGAYNRQWLVPAIVKRDGPAAWRHLRQALVVEVVFLALGVLLATAAMTSGGF